MRVEHDNPPTQACTVKKTYTRPLDIKHGRIDMGHGAGGKAAAQLQADVAKRSVQARSVSQQRQRLVDAVEGGSYLQAQRNARPSVVEVMDELARRLPDGTYLEKVSIEGGQLSLVGLSNQAAALVGKLEGAKQWRAPALSGALQQDPRMRSDRFTLVAQLNDAAATAQAGRKEAAGAPR